MQSIETGQYNRVIVFDRTWVFRFPRSAAGSATMGAEAAVLRALAGSVSVAVPRPEFLHARADESGNSFLGYRWIDGVALTREMAASFSRTQLIALAVALAAFLRDLRAVDVDRSVVPCQTGDYWRDVLVQIKQQLAGCVRPECLDAVRRDFEAFLRDPETVRAPLTLIHGDFGCGNLLVEPQTDALAGVIDFSAACLGDPAVDFAAASTIHPDMLKLMASVDPFIEAHSRRAAFYRGTFPWQEALYGAECGDEDMVKDALRPFLRR